MVGVTTNPTIFAGALANGRALRRAGRASSPPRRVDVDDVDLRADHRRTSRNGCDILAAGRTTPPAGSTAGSRSRSSPTLAHDTDGTIAAAQRAVGRGRPAQRADQDPRHRARACPRSPRALAEGISVNVTLIFSLERYREVMDAYLAGLEQAARRRPSTCRRIHSVASFFVSRVDTEIDKRLETIGTDEALALRGKAGVANARLAYAALRGGRSPASAGKPLAAGGAKPSGRCGPPPASRTRTTATRSTSPSWSSRTPSTRCRRRPSRPSPTTARSRATRSPAPYAQAQRGVRPARRTSASTYDDVIRVLEHEGVEKFETSWTELLETVKGQLDGAKA